ncbi:cysteine hydrolase [Brevibacillus laterosporus]|uniref:cysteine hydrolase family protein n=1 Tax=Brevibacillus laterosporus TaxID=1465 RepID=UPI00036D7687|nr:isochorismatase family cysteine hydrolase [Brevibacillus laterosporus]ATO51469.1 isochorismatase [Brevibacillus laterosporus DSM 25]MBG9801285.1 isochorismatase [Brevibacillus laterosporus]MED2002818.1 cysteine hydrolase [Brevibacillus laterosporus]MED4765181.1 cysteine hydrolase [Brevibacillus laterosporus]TPH12453.1 cysteine hydrolase [Brevibacillus laterosporus]
MNQKAILIIDYTNDFVATNGALTCGEPAQKIEERIVHLTNHFLQEGEFVVMAIDAHEERDPFHPESKLYPPHNMLGSEGRQLYGELQNLYKQKEAFIYWMDKTRYSAFEGTDLALQLYTRGIRQIHLVGTCTDICILHTAVSAWYLGFEVIIHEDAVASFNSVGHDWALQHCKNQMGMQVVTNY